MQDEETVTRWRKVGEQAFREMDAWREAHAHATFAEIEAAAEDRLGPVRIALIQDAVAAQADGEVAAERPSCADCGHALEARGTRERAVTVRGNRMVRVRRQYLVCPACGAGVFPPG